MVQIDLERPPHNGGGPGHDTAACDTPNPPWYCDTNTPDANIDAGIFLLLVVGMLLGMITLFKKLKLKR